MVKSNIKSPLGINGVGKVIFFTISLKKKKTAIEFTRVWNMYLNNCKGFLIVE